MVDIPGLNPIPKNLNGKYGGIIPRQPFSFNLTACGMLTWGAAFGGTAGVIAAFIFGLTTNEGGGRFLEDSQFNENLFRESREFDFSDRSGFEFEDFSPGLSR